MTATFTNTSKSASGGATPLVASGTTPTYSNASKSPSGGATPISGTVTNFFLLQENGDFLLLETGDNIIVSSSSSQGISWVNTPKS